MKPLKITRVINRKRYSTETAEMLCGNDWWDGNNYERGGTQQFLYRTKNGALFFHTRSQWQGAVDGDIIPCSEDSAMDFFEVCDSHGESCMTFEEAFPAATVEDA